MNRYHFYRRHKQNINEQWAKKLPLIFWNRGLFILTSSTHFLCIARSYFKSGANFCGNRRFNDGSSALSTHATSSKCVPWPARWFIWISNDHFTRLLVQCQKTHFVSFRRCPKVLKLYHVFLKDKMTKKSTYTINRWLSLTWQHTKRCLYFNKSLFL